MTPALVCNNMARERNSPGLQGFDSFHPFLYLATCFFAADISDDYFAGGIYEEIGRDADDTVEA